MAGRWPLHTLLLLLTGLAVLFSCCAPRLTKKELEMQYGRHAPAIVKYGAVDRLKSGQTWQVFLAAQDPDGDMKEVIFELYQTGKGWYPAHWRRLKGEERRSFAGYFFLNTPAFWSTELFAQKLTLKCRVRDTCGHDSNLIALPLEFIGREVPQPVPKGFSEREIRSLGPIMIDIIPEDNGEEKVKILP